MLIKAFRERVRKSGYKLAVKTSSNALTYNELDIITQNVAIQIRAKIDNIKNNHKEPVAALMFEHGADMIIGSLGALKAKTVYVPFDPTYPESRLLYMLNDSGASLIVTNNKNYELAAKLASKAINRVDVLNISNSSLPKSKEESLPNDEGDCIAYLLYTSGSTGRPKGVVQTHRNILHFANSYINTLGLTEDDRLTLFSVFSHDASIVDIYSGLLSGACLYPYNMKEQANLGKLSNWMLNENITIWHSVPTLYRYFLNTLSSTEEFPRLKYVVLGGENVTEHDVVRHRSLLKNVTLVNLYGQSESSFNSCQLIKPEDSFEGINIGAAVPETKVLVLNERDKKVSALRSGEIVIASDYLALKYWNDPERTEAVFCRHPEYGNIYRTGDLGWVSLNGSIEFRGRKDFQIKIRGYRVELAEIEKCLLKCGQLTEAVVIGKADKDDEISLYAYVISDKAVIAEELREYLSKELPEYMIPSCFIQLEKMPLTPTNKIDRLALEKIDIVMDKCISYEAPRNELEEKLVSIWQEILKIEPIGIRDNFFELGGHSLKADAMLSQVEKSLNVEVPLTEVFKASTIKELAEYISGLGKNEYKTIEPVGKNKYYKLSSAQSRLFALQLMDKDSTAYNISHILEIEGSLDNNRLEKVFRELIKRHESLRTSFHIDGEEIVQRINDEAELNIEYYKAENEEAIMKIVKGFIRPFDLSNAPLLRTGLIALDIDGDEQHRRYIWMIDMHHIIADGTSVGILIRELGELYKGEKLPELRIQYKDYAVWQRARLEGELKKQEAYWLEEYNGAIPALELSTDYPRPVLQSFDGDKIKLELGKKLTNKLKRIGQETGTTIYMLLLSGLNILLSKYSGQEDIIVGSPIAGRHHADLEKIIGMFVNTLAIRNYPKGSKTFKSFLMEVKEKALKAYENQEYQFEELIEKLNVRRDTGRNPMFDIMLAVQNMEHGEIELEGVHIKPCEMENRISKFDITITATETKENIELAVEYCTKLYRKETVEQMMAHLINILEEVSQNPDVVLEKLEMLSQVDRQKLIYEFNDTYTDYPKDKTIHELFEAQAGKTPGNIAAAYEDSQLTYRELNERANHLAWLLREKGVKPDSIVGIMVERSLEMLVGILGILKAGGAYLPVDPEYPRDRISYMLEDSGTRILLTQKHLRSNIAFNGEIIELEDERLYEGETCNLEEANTSKDLAYIMYTSGSTGKPKGVMIEHKSVVRLVKDTNYIELDEKDRILQTGAIVFDAITFEIWGALLNGLSLYLVSKDKILDADKLKQEIEKNGITTLWLTSSLFNQIVDQNASTFEKCRNLLVGGDILSPKHINEIRNNNKEIRIINGYGPTENTTFTTCFTIEKAYEANIPIGKPISNARVYILDQKNNLKPIGAAGEICIAGEGLARGYLNSADLTAEKFVENPYEPGERMYRTGDLGRWLPDGSIEFLGRIDHQVKIRGYRIELDEIVKQLQQHDAVKEAIVTAKEEQSGSKYLCAYIVGDRKIITAELKEYLNKELPEYMTPSYFVQMDRLPLTANGKIDRKALPEPDRSIETGVEYEAPRDDIEQRLASIWQEVLTIERIGINDNFFELGGHSLKAAKAVSKLNKEFNVEVQLREIFRTPTIRGIAEYIKGQEENIYASIERVEEKEYYELSSAQKRLYTLQQFDPESIVYNMPGILEIKGRLDVEKLTTAFRKLIERHEALRTSFELVEDRVIQKIHKKVEFEIEYSTNKIVEEDISKIVNAFILPFKLSKAPLLRVRLAALSNNSDASSEKHILLFDMHHIISDGTSMGILVEELMALYEGKVLSELRLQYKDYAAWQNKMMDSDIMKKQEEYWLKRYEGELPVLNLPIDYPRPAVQGFEGYNIKFELEEAIIGGLRRIAKEMGATMYMVLLSGINILLSKYSGQEDIIVGSPIAGRPHADLENILGMFVNTLAIRNYPESSKTVKEFLAEVKANALKAYENQGCQFEELVEKLDVRRDMSRNPIFDVMFAMQNTGIRELEIDGLEFRELERKSSISKFDLTIDAIELQDKISLNVSYSTKLFSVDTINRMVMHLKNIFVDIIQSTDKRISEIEMQNEEDKQQLLYEFNNTYVEYPKDKTIHELFEEQVELTPNNAAVVHESSQLTYRELNEKANQLARVLREKGVVPDSIVGIMAERSLELIIGIIAILKAGGAYLPIDTEYPAERIRFMLEDSKAEIWLTHKGLGENIECKAERIGLDEAVFCDRDRHNLENYGGCNDLAYIMYTSGSTGKPKGVMIENKSVVRLVKNNDYVGIKQGDRILQTGSIVFDATTFEIWGALLNGASLYLVDKEKIVNAEKLGIEIENNKITTLWLTAPLYNQIVEQKPEALAKCCNLLVGGDVLSPKHINKVKKINKEIRIINGYGPTENTTFSTCYTIEKEYDSTIPIGKPIKNSTAYILGKNAELQPIGIPGEIYVGGDGLARGYLNQPELTAEKFVENPFKPGERLYKTGDLGRWLPDGNIEFMGRIDNQVKIRGFRIELEEIENQLLKHEAVKEAVVAAKENENSSKYLCAYITILEDRQITVTDMREHLKKELPDYAIPSYFVQLVKIPLTSNGKIDKKALPEPNGSIVTGTVYEAPKNDTEKKLVTIWQEVLGIEEIGITDNFFELGGHSLKATSLTAKIHKEFNVDIPLREIFKIPTIKEISEHILNLDKNIYSKIQKVEEKEYYELSSAQKRIYALQQLDLESTAYNMPCILVVEGKLDTERLEAAFWMLIKRHESLRTSFILKEEAVQRIHQKVEFKVEYKDNVLSEKEIERIVKGFIRPFDLSNAPLLSVGLIKVRHEKHILMIDMHHIISDGTSMVILVKEFAELYEGKELSEAKLQYKDYAVWKNERLKKGEIKQQEEYWKKEYEGEIPILNLPTDFPRPELQSFEGDRIKCGLGKRVTEGIRKISSETGTTTYMVLLAGFTILLSKYSGQDDIVVGSPIAGRPHADLENIIGMFVNTLAMRNYPEGKKTYRKFLSEVRERALKAYENQDYQFEELVEKVNVKRDLSRNPLFDVMLAMQNTERGETKLEGINIKSYDTENLIAKFDITISAVEAEEDIQLNVEYCTKLYKKDTIKRMIEHLANILERVGQNLDITLEEIEMISEEERRQLLYEFNNTDVEYPMGKLLHGLFEEQVERTPDNAAVVYEARQLTYKELNEKANMLARVLRDKGIAEDSIVGIMVERSPEMIIGLLGILKAGGAYLPIDPEYPEDRISYILEDSGAGILLTQAQLKGKTTYSGNIIVLDDEKLYAGEVSNLCAVNKSEDLAYIIYTSGTTGKPKGVMIEHRGISNSIQWKKAEYKLDEEDKVLLQISYAFDAFTSCLFTAITSGTKIILLKEYESKDPIAVKAFISNNRITHIESTPMFYSAILDCSTVKELSSLKSITLGGDKLGESIVTRSRGKGVTAKIYNEYGPTENSVVTTVNNNIMSEREINIGKPIANTKIYIIGGNGRLQPIGVAGELCIGGAGLARGYLNRNELTAAKFISNPFEPQKRMYKTGDLARWMSDGNIEFLGRMDHQVKIRGFRIELGEIESQLLGHEAMKEAVVIAREEQGEGWYLCAYIVADKELTTEELREYLSKELPGYMIPSYFIQLVKMPLTPNGKIDRKALPEPSRNISTGIEYELPRNEMEEKLVLVWQEVLKADRVGIKDNFFALGGDSIKAIQVAARIQKYGYKLQIKELLRHPSIEELSKYITAVGRTAEQGVITGEAELTPVQRWFFEQQFNEKHHWNQAVMLDSKDGFDEKLIKRVFEKIVEHHDILRSVYIEEEGRIIQRIRAAEGELFTLKVWDYREKADYTERIEKEANKLQRSIDLSKGPLVKLGLFKTAEGDHLLIVIHHLVIDGVSWRILFENLTLGYQQALNNEEIVFPPKTSAFRDWGKNIKEYASSNAVLEEITYWKNVENTKLQPFPKDYTVDKRSVKDNKKESIILSEQETEALLKNTGKSYQTQINDILLTALGLSIKEWTKENKILINLEGHGRQELFEGLDVTRTVGWFTAAYPVVLDMSESDDISLQIMQVKESLRHIPNNGIGYWILRYLTDKDLKKDLVFKLEPEILFNYLGQIDEDISTDVFTASRMSSGKTIGGNNENKNVLDVSGVIIDRRLNITFTYNRHEYNQDTILGIARSYKNNLIHIIEHCSNENRGEALIEAAAAKTAFREDKISYDYKKHLEEDVMVLLNEKKDRNIFVFPPIVGYGITYIPLAKLINFHSIYSFDFIENDDRIERYIRLITSVEKEDPYILMGYCAGGNLAFEVAKELEKKGYEVSDIILIDADYLEEKEKDSAYFAEVRKQNEVRLNNIREYVRLNSLPVEEYIEENIKRKLDVYSEYEERLINTGAVNANIYNILSLSSTSNEKFNLNRQWEKSTNKSTRLYQGFGIHNDMLSEGYVEKNVEIINEILANIK